MSHSVPPETSSHYGLGGYIALGFGDGSTSILSTTPHSASGTKTAQNATRIQYSTTIHQIWKSHSTGSQTRSTSSISSSSLTLTSTAATKHSDLSVSPYANATSPNATKPLNDTFNLTGPEAACQTLWDSYNGKLEAWLMAEIVATKTTLVTSLSTSLSYIQSEAPSVYETDAATSTWTDSYQLITGYTSVSDS